MADYKIANIKWLREKGWEISSSYADSICPTYNEIVNEIPKSSIKVDVNGTCIATSKAYANNQLVCESDITIEPVVDCSKYGFTANTLNEVTSTSSTQQLALSIYSEGELTATVVEGSDVVTRITAPTAGPYYQYIGWFAENQSTSPKHAKIRYTSSDGCEWEQTVTQKGAVDCNSVYQFSTITAPLEAHTTAPIAWSIDSLEKLTYTIMNSGGFLTGITSVQTADRWQYMGEFNTTTSTSDRTATIEYKNSDGTCVFSQELVMKGETCTCSQINVSITELNISADSALTQVGDITTNDCAPNVTYESTQPTWLSGVTTGTNNIRIKCSKNTAYNSRSGSVNVKMNGTTCSTVNVTQKGKPAPQYSVSTNLIISNGSSGSLSVTGSTYTAEFVIAGPNAGTGTLTGTLTPDTRDKMTFSGQWDGRPGATIYNSCTSHAPQGIYAIGDAHWDISLPKLYVNLIQCTP